MFEELQVKLDFIVLENAPFDVVIGRTIIKGLKSVLDLLAEVLRFSYKGRSAVLPMMPTYMRLREMTGATDSNKFASK